ncbi:discoidin, CUB and LCCL domain-containing protein 1 [Pimephales promelas]|uniref:discoidin, CUB and LCCL domain-containing protein 1 n=1 Tax=Pimephales promelas TaxID=90988 RepID=UPI001955D8C9|nr:discoidin, CUB and LCCL domain-containing protein 1 [Pimephales promelas]KAG1963426.1 discoidin, CUB and LCCL domain-containing protein [Pimephales promelas]KAG1963429.1 discoidin, CUB and LCCL domain-containing protein [Pimephales promelas]
MSGHTALHGLILLYSIHPLVLAEKPDDGCGHYVLGQESGVLSSKNYPGTYPNNSWCEWRIRVPIGHTIILKFGDLNMEKKDCESDYLKVLKGSYGAENVYWEYCGGPMPKPTQIHTDSSELTVRFRSSQHISGRGFLLSYSTENHKELLTCLDRGSHFTASQYRKYCPAGCAAVTGDVSGDISLGYRHTSVLCKAAVHAGVIMDQFGGPITVEERRGLSHYPAVRANGVQSKDGSLSETLFTFVTNDCSQQTVFLHPVGSTTNLSTHNISCDGTEVDWSPNSIQPGISEDLNHNHPQWLQIDLGEKRRITGILTTGLTIANTEYFVKNYKIEYKERNRWRTFVQYNNSDDMTFEGNTDSLHQTRNTFHPSIVARSIRFVPQQWHRIIAVRLQLLGCPYVKPIPVNSSSQVTQEAQPTQPIHNDMTKPVPSQADLVNLVVIIAPTILLVVLILVGICLFKMLYNKKTKENTYGSAENHHTGCWRQIKQPFARHQSTEFTIKYSSEKDPIQKLDLVTREMAAEYQQPLMLGTDTVSRKGSTFRPMDTEAKDKDSEATSHYDQLQTGIQYALPLTNQEPEYATPIIERHAFRKDPFLPDPSYSVPGVVLNKSPSFRAVEGSNCRKVIGGLAGGYQTPQVKLDRGNYPEDIYDSPKIQKPVVKNGSCSAYQRPQIKSPEQECYSTPRDCVRLPFSGLRPDPEGSSSEGS